MSTLELSTCPDLVRSPIDLFLDRVEQALLAAGIARPARATVVETLKSDVLSQLTARTAGRTPEQGDIAEVLKRMGQGQGLADAPGISAGVSSVEWRRYVRSLAPRRSRCAFWGAVCIGLSLLPMVAIFVILSFFTPQAVHVEADFPRDRVHAEIGAPHDLESTGAATVFRATFPDGFIHAVSATAAPLVRFWWLFTPLTPLAFAGTLLGWIALLDIGRSRGKMTGFGSALFVALFYPLLLAMVTIWLW